MDRALAEDARRQGTTPEQVVSSDLLRRYAPAPAGKPANAMLALFVEWDAEDATEDPDEIARRNREWEETEANLAANRFTLEGRTDFGALLGGDV